MVTLFEKKETKKTKGQLRNLVAMAMMDKKLAKSEAECIFKIGQQKGLSKEKIRQIIKAKGTMKMYVPQEITEKFEHVYDMVQVMLADGIIKDEEVEFCVDMAGKIGVRSATRGLLITKITNDLLSGKKKEKIFSEAVPFLA